MRTFGCTLAIFTVSILLPVGASAAPILVSGSSTGANATASGTLSLDYGATPDALTLVLTNTSPFDARITGVGFDFGPGAADNTGIDGFSGTQVQGFTFSDGDLGNVPQFNTAVLDFGWTTGNSGNFNGGSPNNGLAPGNSLTFIATGLFPIGLSETTLANALFVRFQRVGAGGGGSDVGRGRAGGGSSGQPFVPTPEPGGGGGSGQPIVPGQVPEPASATLLALGAVATLWIRQRRR